VKIVENNSVAYTKRFAYLRAMTPQQEVAAILDRKGWTQYELAKRSGLPRSTIKRIMDGKAAILSTTMDKIRVASKARR